MYRNRIAFFLKKKESHNKTSGIIIQRRSAMYSAQLTEKIDNGEEIRAITQQAIRSRYAVNAKFTRRNQEEWIRMIIARKRRNFSEQRRLDKEAHDAHSPRKTNFQVSASLISPSITRCNSLSFVTSASSIHLEIGMRPYALLLLTLMECAWNNITTKWFVGKGISKCWYILPHPCILHTNVQRISSNIPVYTWIFSL